MLELEGSWPIMNTLLYQFQYPNRFDREKQVWLEKGRMSVTMDNRVPGHKEALKLCESTKSWKEELRPTAGKERVCISSCDDKMISIYPGVSQIYNPYCSVHVKYLLTTVPPSPILLSPSPYSLYFVMPPMPLSPLLVLLCLYLPPTGIPLWNWVAVVLRNGFSHHYSSMALCAKQISSVLSNMSKKEFRLARMAPSEWTRSIIAVRHIPVAACSVLGVNTTCRVAYHPHIALSLFLLTLSVSYIERTFWRSGQQWPCIGMDSLGMRLHWHCNAMGDAAQTSPRFPSTWADIAILSLLIIHMITSRQIYVAIDNRSLVLSVSCLTTRSYLWNYVHAADDVSHCENLQRNSRRCFSHLYKFRDGIQVTRVFR